MVAVLVLADLVQFVLLLNLKRGLLNGLIEENVEDGLHLDIVIEEVVVFNLSDFVNASFLRYVFWRRGLWLEMVRLLLNFYFFWLFSALLCEEIS